MSMFRNVRERGFNLFSAQSKRSARKRGITPANRRARVLNLEALEIRKLLSVSPGLGPDESFGLGDDASQSETYTDTAAMVSTMVPGTGAETGAAGAVSEAEALPEATGVAPEAADDAFAMASTQQLGGGVLANDQDADGDDLTVTLQSDTEHGQLDLRSNGLFTYRPDVDFGGVDSFTYTVSDGANESGPATVTIEVTSAGYHTPEAAEDTYSLVEGETLTVDRSEGVLANDGDADGDSIYASLVSAPEHGTLTMGRYGSFTYTPDADFHGADRFSYVARDIDGESAVTTVALTVDAVNDAPSSAEDAYALAEDGVLTVDAVDGVLGNDTDADEDVLTASIVDQPTHGTVTLAEDGSFEYTPEPDFHGEDGFTYVANDGTADGTVTGVSITVEAANDGPVSAADAYMVAEDAVLEVDAIDGVLANDSDAEGDPLTVRLVDEPSHGSVKLAEDGSFEYTPEPDFHGTDGFTYIASDGQADGALTQVNLTVEALNDAPTAAEDAYATDKDTVLTVEAGDGVLANDADPDADPLSVRLVEGPSRGTVNLAADGSFQYTPEPGFHGRDSFRYVSGDGQAESEPTTVSVDVNGARLSIELEVSSTPFGGEVDTLWTDSTFWVSAFVQDLRDVPEGVIGGAIDVLYDGEAVTPTGEIVYGDSFGDFQQGEVNGEEGLIDETGALATTGMVGAGEAAPFVSWQFSRTGEAGTFVNGGTQFSVDPAEGTSTILPSNFAMTGSGEPVPWSDVEMGSAGVDLIYADFNGDARVDHFDLALWVPHAGTSADSALSLSAADASSGGYDPMYDLDSNSAIDQGDLDLLLSGMYSVADSSEAVAAPAIEDPGAMEGEAPASEGALEETDPVLAIDDLLASGNLWS